jgi:surface antigen
VWRMSFACPAVAIVAVARALAAPCYLPAEVEADQAIRLKTELMVIAEACNDPSYARFLDRNRDTLAAYEQILAERFAREGGESAAAGLRTYLLKLDGESTLRAAASPSFCADAFDLVANTSGMRPAELRSYAAARAEAARQDYAICGQPTGPSQSATAADAPEAAPAVTSYPLDLPPDPDEYGVAYNLIDRDLAPQLDLIDRLRLRSATQRTLETAVSGQATSWRNPFSQNAGAVVAARAFRNAAGQWCRGFEQSVTMINGETHRGKDTACRRTDGRWEIDKTGFPQ